MEGTIGAADLPGLWNEKYQQYLGVKVDSDANGVLQDIGRNVAPDTSVAIFNTTTNEIIFSVGGDAHEGPVGVPREVELLVTHRLAKDVEIACDVGGRHVIDDRAGVPSARSPDPALEAQSSAHLRATLGIGGQLAHRFEVVQ